MRLRNDERAVLLHKQDVGATGLLDIGAGLGVEIQVLGIALAVSLHRGLEGHGVVEAGLDVAGAVRCSAVVLGNAQLNGLEATLKVRTDRGHENAERVLRSGSHADHVTGADHKRTHIQGCAGAEGRNPCGFGGNDLLDGLDKLVLGERGQMDKEKLLTKTHGGAIYKDKTHDMTDLTSRAYLFHDRALENKDAKEEIANEAIKLVSDHMCIFLDASSTAYTLGMKLSGFTELTVITNGINLALELKDTPGVTVILTGGIVTSASASIEGLLGADLLKKIHTDIAFVSARGFSVEDGLTDFSIYEADLKRMCIKASSKTVALVDHTKFDTTSISSYASLDDINMVITDSGISPETADIYEKAGTDIVISGT